MVYFIYDILLFLASVLYLPFYALRGRVHRAILIRLGFFKKGLFEHLKDQEVVWIHAVSVGEARAAESLVRLIRVQWPRRRIVISTVTPTGQEIVRRILGEGELAFYAPLDISCVVKKFLRQISPKLLIIMETELWPNLIRLAKERGCAVVIVNGRISDRSFQKYRRIRFLLRPILGVIDLFCMQTPEAKERFIALGAPASRVAISGNIKFDITAELKESSLVKQLRQVFVSGLLWVAGSTHENEEEIILDIYRSLRKDFPALRLLVAPRHLERIDKIRHQIRLRGLGSVRASRLKQMAVGSQVVLLDTIGDLTMVYALADVVFVGGSLVKRGGHNLIEPAIFGKPILFGPHMFNFKEIRDTFVKERAGMEVAHPQELEYELRRLLASASERKALGERARGLIEKNRGAAARTFSQLLALVP